MKTGTEHELLNINNLSFSYENGSEILKNINLKANHGESIGLIGANGVGKSTLLKLLVGLNINYSGGLEVAHHKMSKENLNHIREQDSVGEGLGNFLQLPFVLGCFDK